MSERTMMRSGESASPAMAEVMEATATCMQCGTCSASCPVGSAMDYSLRHLMLLLQQGRSQEALSSRTIWLCASCYSCTVRCPRGIPVTDLLAELRGIAIDEGYAETTGMTFAKAFLKVVERYGRMFEPELMLRYHFRQEQLGLLGATPVAISLVRKGKISFLPERLPAAEGGDEVRRIFERVAARRKAMASEQG
jgi:heterodisulfide reductase subunit C2